MKNRTVSARCFRLLALVSEVQNDVEVVKPILQELEVMRLSCALEMLSNVNVKDMEHEMLEASEFDDDFARFLRQELFGGRSGEDKSTKRVSVASAFGKQSEVKHHLQTLHAWDFGMEHHIREQEQGIYAVFLPDDSMSDENPPPKLVVFGWLVDSCFEPEHLRDTSTYILRFLTCLSSHVTCCLTKEDWPGLQAVMRAKDSSDMDNWNSYSVVFCVERQQDEEDSVEASLTQSLRLPRSITSEGLQLVKGKFPALVRCSAEAKTKRQTNRKHELDSPEEFALWMVDRAQQFELNWNRDDWQTSLKEALLHAADEWPGDTLKRIRVVKQSDQRAVELNLLSDTWQNYLLDVMEEMWEPESEEMEIHKFNIGQVTGSAFSRFSRLGTIRLDKDEHVLSVYTI
ncbi:hypothetical protein Poli38472_012944 [Pythium oligandrum]|uniref:Uncharacterized protein n=1 Tax=Pythium oligandrum TaxID=41045 RepID=A0A8K1FLY9_PYTOL|nr:hypothetical protein Poli38472_012944 [Pythium oligandrum]|eukprot:TMW64322.1 hypothetical protein Poli38472_012944 [Pythium oligandrum]